MAHRDSHPANRRLAAADIRYDRDTIDIHARIL
jgi:hypothetical protein